MKKVITVLLAILLMASVLSASAEGENRAASTLVVYFSRAGENYSVGVIDEGNTAKMARIIADQLGADLFAIEPEEPYPENYEETKTIATREKNENIYPAYIGDVENWKQYDTVLIGYPIWWAGVPNIVYRFLDEHDFTGKTVIPFNTHEGSGQAGTQADIESRLTGVTVLQGLAVRGSKAQNDADGTAKDVYNWLKGLGLAE